MIEKEILKLDAWIWKTLFKGAVISKRFSLKRTGFKLRDESGEWPNNGGLHGWGWQSSRESALLHIPRYSTSRAAMQVLEKCGEKTEVLECMYFGKVAQGWLVGHEALKIEEDGDTLPMAICMFAKQLFSKNS